MWLQESVHKKTVFGFSGTFMNYAVKSKIEVLAESLAHRSSRMLTRGQTRSMDIHGLWDIHGRAGKRSEKVSTCLGNALETR